MSEFSVDLYTNKKATLVFDNGDKMSVRIESISHRFIENRSPFTNKLYTKTEIVFQCVEDTEQLKIGG